MEKLISFVITIFFLQAICFGQEAEYPNRIVSLSPAITEILYELDLGERVVGVTDYCDFPDEVKDKSRIGGYLDTNYEAIILLKPDLVIVPVVYSEEIKGVFDKAGIEYMMINTFTVDGIIKTIEKIGQRCGVNDRAEEVIARIRNEMDRLKELSLDQTL